MVSDAVNIAPAVVFERESIRERPNSIVPDAVNPSLSKTYIEREHENMMEILCVGHWVYVPLTDLCDKRSMRTWFFVRVGRCAMKGNLRRVMTRLRKSECRTRGNGLSACPNPGRPHSYPSRPKTVKTVSRRGIVGRHHNLVLF